MLSFRFCLICLIKLLYVQVSAQNLIPNPSFDSLLPNYSYTPRLDIPIDNNYPYWQPINGGSPDIFHDSVSSGQERTASNVNGRVSYQSPRSGPGMLGLGYLRKVSPRPNTPLDNGYRECAQARLLEPLDSGATYSFGMYVNIASTSLYTIAPLGVTFSVDSIVENKVPFDSIDYTIQFEEDRFVKDSVGWEYFYYCFKPDSAYNFILLGNRRTKLVFNTVYYDSTNENRRFKNLGTTYLCFDDLSLVKIGEPFFSAKERVLCRNGTDSIELSSRGGNHTFWWIDKQNPTVILGRDSVLTVKPSRNTTYIVYNDIKDTVEIVVAIADPPVFTLGLDSNLCSYDTLNLVSGLPTALIDEYQWSTNQTSSGITVDNTNAQVWHQVTDTNGCVWRDTLNLTWQTPPKVVLSNDTLICEGSTVELGAFVSLSGAEVWTKDYNLTWQTNASLTVTSDSTASVTPPVDTYYYATVDDGKCTGNTDSVFVEVKANPITSITPKSQTICQGVQTEITAAGGQTYLWDIGGSVGAETSNNKRTLSSVVSTYIAVQSIDAPCSGVWDTAFVTIDNLPIAADFTVSPDSGSTVFEPVVQNLSDGGDWYQWNFGNGDIRTVTAAEDAGVFGNESSLTVETIGEKGVGGVRATSLKITNKGNTFSGTVSFLIGDYSGPNLDNYSSGGGFVITYDISNQSQRGMFIDHYRQFLKSGQLTHY